MPTTSLHDFILKTLAGSTSQKPVYLSKLKSKLVPEVRLAELTSKLNSMYLNREIQTCSGVKNGQAYVCYWISGNLPPAWGKPSKAVAVVKKAAKV